MKSKAITPVSFITAAIFVWWLCLETPPSHRPAIWLANVSAIGLTFSAILVSRFPRPAHTTGLVASCIGMCWFLQIELFEFPVLNTWILFNLPPENPALLLAGLRVLCGLTLLFAMGLSVIRLLPARWPLREKTWPVSVGCIVVMAAWFWVSAIPYRIPFFVEAVTPELVILHVEKDGLDYRETSFSVYSGSRFFAERSQRRLFHYRFVVRNGSGVLPSSTYSGIAEFTRSEALKGISTQPAVALRSWKAEGWYVQSRNGVLAFTSEYGTQPPGKVVQIFDSVDRIADTRDSSTRSDVCLGFCYDPLAGLGLRYLGSRGDR